MKSGSVICAVCGKRHPFAESELFFQRPDPIWEMSQSQRTKRCKESDVLCLLRGVGLKRDRHFVRAVMPLPVVGRPTPYRIGVWVETAKKDFFRILDLWSAETQHQEPPFKGKLANQFPVNERTLGLKVDLQLAGPKERPAVLVPKSDHYLYREQSEGITPHRAYEYTPGKE